MTDTIKTLSIEGFKSIRRLEHFELRHLNVLIGANGAGKSNFVSFFRLLREMIEQRLQVSVSSDGGADALLFQGPKITKQLKARLSFGANGYEFTLLPSSDGRFVFADEKVTFDGNFGQSSTRLGAGHFEAKLKDRKDDSGATARHGVPYYVFNSVSNWVVYHFHDTSPTAGVRRQGPLNDDEFLRPNAENLAAFLYRIQKTNPDSYERVKSVVRLAAPFFDDFRLRPVSTNTDLIQLEWLQKDSDYIFRANQLSDGTLRFICLATALLQPTLPSTILFDEPELGMHPYALSLLGGLFQKAASRYGTYVSKQVIVSTQSALLLNEFEPEDVIVVDRASGESIFTRLQSEQLRGWLEAYSLGELWQKNIIGGRPHNEHAHEPALPQDGR